MTLDFAQILKGVSESIQVDEAAGIRTQAAELRARSSHLAEQREAMTRQISQVEGQLEAIATLGGSLTDVTRARSQLDELRAGVAAIQGQEATIAGEITALHAAPVFRADMARLSLVCQAYQDHQGAIGPALARIEQAAHTLDLATAEYATIRADLLAEYTGALTAWRGIVAAWPGFPLSVPMPQQGNMGAVSGRIDGAHTSIKWTS